MLPNVFYCEHCSQVFINTTGDFTQHMKSHSTMKSTVFACSLCEQKFKSQSLLDDHIMVHIYEKPFECINCPKTFRTRAQLVLHAKSHTERFRCTICNKGHTGKKSLEEHERVHTGEKPYKCNKCDKAFHRYSGLHNHRKTHIKKPFSCKYCKQTFSEQKHCDTHMKFHTDRDRTYSCEICNTEFKFMQSLKAHLRMHTGQKPYPCSQCKKVFVTEKMLQRHYKRKHTNENSKVYEVSIAPSEDLRSFASEATLKDHAYFQASKGGIDDQALNKAIDSSVGYTKSRKKLPTSKGRNDVKKHNRLVPLVNSANLRENCSDYIERAPVGLEHDTEQPSYHIPANLSHETGNVCHAKDSSDYTLYNMLEVGNCIILLEDSSTETNNPDLGAYCGNHTDDHSTTKDNIKHVIHDENLHRSNTNLDHSSSAADCEKNGEKVVSLIGDYSKNVKYSEYHKNQVEDHAVYPEEVVNHGEDNSIYVEDRIELLTSESQDCVYAGATDDPKNCVEKEANGAKVCLHSAENQNYSTECYQSDSNKLASFKENKELPIENNRSYVTECIIHTDEHANHKNAHSSYTEDSGHSKEQINSKECHKIAKLEHVVDTRASQIEIQSLYVQEDLKSRGVSYTDVSDLQADNNHVGNHTSHAEERKNSINDHSYCKCDVSDYEIYSSYNAGQSSHLEDDRQFLNNPACNTELSDSMVSEKESTKKNGIKTYSCVHCSKTFTKSKFLLGHLLLHRRNNACSCQHCRRKYSIEGHIINMGKTMKNVSNNQSNTSNIRHCKIISGKRNKQTYGRDLHQNNTNLSINNADNASINDDDTTFSTLLQLYHESPTSSIKYDKNVIDSYQHDNLNKNSKTQSTLGFNQNNYLNAIMNELLNALHCKDCNKTFSSSQRKFNHMEKLHRRIYSCKHCSKQFSGTINLNKHLKVHKNFPCQHCDKSFRQKKNLVYHLNIHSGERPYVCTYCKKAFRHKVTLSSHMKMHTGKNLHSCTYCEQKFIHKFSLSEHIRFHTGEKPYVCPHCHKAFSRIFNFTSHVKKHAIDRPFACHYCKKRFVKKEKRDAHLNFHAQRKNLHLLEKMFSCTFCSKTFHYRQSLQKHTKTHIGESCYSCQYCQKKFTSERYLNRHEKNHLVNKQHVITVHRLNGVSDDASENIEFIRQEKITENFPDNALKLLLQQSEIPITDIYIQTT